MPHSRRESDDRRSRILVVDDHELVRYGLAQLIKNVEDWVVCGEAADASEALRIVREKQPNLAIIDLSLKDGSGLALIKQINATCPQLRMLVNSMHEESLFAERCLRAGAHGYVHKQQPAEILLTAIRRVLEGDLYLSGDQMQRLLVRATRGSVDPSVQSVDLLSDRELEIFELIGRGRSVKEIARNLHLSSKTVEYHREHIKEKLGLHSSAEVTRQATIWLLDHT